MPSVLIAGGAGFLGSYLSEYLLAEAFRVIVVDSLTTGRREYLAPFTAHPRFAFVEHNLNQGLPKKIESVDYLVQLAGQELHEEESDNLNMDSLLTNALSTRNLLELAKDCAAVTLITSSVSVYKGALSASSLDHYFGQTPGEEKTFSFNESKRFAESLAFEYHKKYNLDIRVARLGEVYGPRMNFRDSGNLGRFIENVIRGDHLTIYGDGLEKEYYAYIADVIEGLAKCLLKPKISGSIFPITDLTPVTVLEEAYLLKSFALPGTEIIFKPERGELAVPEIEVADGKTQMELRWKPKTNLKDGIRLTLDYFGFNRRNISPVMPVKPGKEEPPFAPIGLYRRRGEKIRWPTVRLPKLTFRIDLKKNLKNRFGAALALLGLVIFLIGLPFLRASFYFALSVLETRQALAEAKNLRISGVSRPLEAASRNLAAAGKSLGGAFIFKSPDLIKLTDSFFHLSQAALFSSRGIGPLDESLNFILANKAPAAAETEARLARFSQGDENLSSALDEVRLAEADYKETETENLPFFIRKNLPSYENLLTGFSEGLTTLSLVNKIAPNLLGLSEERKYLLLFQNSNELRPTGGFIGSIGLVRFKGGSLGQIKIGDVYDLDGQIDERGLHFSQPKFLSDNLKTDSLHLRDANFSPSFPESAERIRRIYSEVTGESPDGVIAVDLQTLERLLTVTGPIFLSTYNETVSADNVFERTQFHAEATYFSGSQQKRTFLSILAQQTLDAFFSLGKGKYLSLLQEVRTLLTEKDILLYLPEVQSTVNRLGFDGSLPEVSGDFLFVVDTNVGANKANFFVRRTLEYQVEQSNRQGEYLANLRVSYRHKGVSDAWPGGPYKNYLRIYTPEKTSLLKAVLSEDDQEGGEDITGQFENGEESGKIFMATTLTVRTGHRLSLLLTYVLPPTVVGPSEAYRMMVAKQPGVRDENLRFKFTLPFAAGSVVPSGFRSVGRTLIFEDFLKKNLSFTISLKPAL